MDLEADNRTRAELQSNVAIARQHVGRFKQAAIIVNDDIVESCIRARVRELETLVAVLEARMAEMID